MKIELLEWLLLGLIYLYVVAFPYSKVEESFGMQAIHDILYHRLDLTKYDHQEFPGVVPRTFLGPLVIVAVSSPFVTLFSALQVKKRYSQYVVRMALGTLVWLSLLAYKRAVGSVWGKRVTFFFLLITMSQFHFLFYSSRTLPNTFALIIVLLSLAAYISQRMIPFICLAGLSILVFRSELCLLFGPCLLLALFYRRLSILRALTIAVPAAFVIIGLTVLVDSFFWGRVIWPEFEVFWFNTVLNRSSEYGSSPVHWYLTSVLPRALLASMPLTLLGLLRGDKAIRLLCTPALLFIGLYSLLPHKELRFIIYTLPLFNTAAAFACSRLIDGKITKRQYSSSSSPSLVHRSVSLACWSHLAVNLATTGLMASAALFNYPGGVAITRLHDIVPTSTASGVAHLHICNLAAQTGVTRFLQENDNWIYNKTEGLESSPRLLTTGQFSHLLVDLQAPNTPASMLKPYLKTGYRTLVLVPGYAGLQRSYPFVRQVDRLALLEWKDDVRTKN